MGFPPDLPASVLSVSKVPFVVLGLPFLVFSALCHRAGAEQMCALFQSMRKPVWFGETMRFSEFLG